MIKYRWKNRAKGGAWDEPPRKIVFVASNTHKYVAKCSLCGTVCRRTPRGVRGLKLDAQVDVIAELRRTPRGVRGLKRQRAYRLDDTLRRTPRGVRGLKH